jgi:hypothetical protein
VLGKLQDGLAIEQTWIYLAGRRKPQTVDRRPDGRDTRLVAERMHRLHEWRTLDCPVDDILVAKRWRQAGEHRREAVVDRAIVLAELGAELSQYFGR